MVARDDAPRPGDVPAGYDEDDPYADEDVSTYPEWWRRNIEQFRDHGMRPYRPPRFTDGAYAPEVVAALETELGVGVLLRAVEPRVGDDWSVVVDGREVATVGRHRSGDGYTVYELPSDAFEALVRDAVSGDLDAEGSGTE